MSYYSRTKAHAENTLARGADVNFEFDAISTAFTNVDTDITQAEADIAALQAGDPPGWGAAIDTRWVLSATGTNTYTAVAPGPPTGSDTLSNGQMYTVYFANTNTAAVTLTLGTSEGAEPVEVYNQGWVALTTGMIVAGIPYLLIYHSAAGKWRLLGIANDPRVLSTKTADYSIVAADLGSHITIPVDINTTGSVDITELALASMRGRLTVKLETDNGDTSTRLVRLMDSGASEVWTGYAKGDYVDVVYSGGARYILSEKVTVEGVAALTSDEALGNGSHVIFDAANYAVPIDIGDWWNSTTHRLVAAFDCYVSINVTLLSANVGDIVPYYSIDGVIKYDMPGTSWTAANIPHQSLTLIRRLDGTDVVAIGARVQTGSPSVDLLGDALQDESLFSWKVLRRVR